MNDFWKDNGVTAWLHLDHRSPVLTLDWPQLPSVAYSHWSDQGSFGVDLLRSASGAAAWGVIEAAVPGVASVVRETVARAGARPPEEPNVARRVWARTVCRGFLPGDLDDELSLTVDAAGAHCFTGTHSYGRYSFAETTHATLAELADPACALRREFDAVLPRVDAFLRLWTRPYGGMRGP